MPKELQEETLKASFRLIDRKDPEPPAWLDEEGKINEPLFAEYFLQENPMRCFHGKLFTVDGIIEDESALEHQIYDLISPYTPRGIVKKAKAILQAVKISCESDPPKAQTDRIHTANGTYFLDGYFTPDKEYCMNRLPVNYNPQAQAPERWLSFLNELLFPEDIPTLQEFIGYCLVPDTKAQKMLIVVGKGGEGKSRIGLVMRALFGDSMYSGSLQKIERNRFSLANLEFKLVFVDDDMDMEALPQTGTIKKIVTQEDRMDIEQKGVQSYQGTVYSRLVGFGNGSLQALYDKSAGFYRRQLLLLTRDRPEDRVDDPFLIDKMREEKEGIFLWAIDGLERLIKNNYSFTISEQSADNLNQAMEQGNNILAFIQAGDRFDIIEGERCKSTDFYACYKRWCEDNMEKPLAASTFLHHMRENQKSLGIIYEERCVDRCRGFRNVYLHPFVPVDGPKHFNEGYY